MNERIKHVVGPYFHHKGLQGLAFLFSILETMAFLVMPFVLRYFIGDVLVGDDQNRVLLTLLIYFLVVLAIVVFGYLKSWLNSVINEKVAGEIKLHLVNRIMEAKHACVEEYNTGELISYVVNDAQDMAGHLSRTFCSIVENVIRLIVGFIVLFSFDGKLLGVVLLFLPLYLLDVLYFNKPIKKSSIEVQKAKESLTVKAQEILRSRIGLIVNKRVAWSIEEVSKPINGLKSKNIVNSLWINTSTSIGFMIYWAAVITVYVLGGLKVIEGLMTIGTLIFYAQYIDNIYMPLKLLIHNNAEIQQALGAEERIRALTRELAPRKIPRTDATAHPLYGNRIEVKDLSYKYVDSYVFKELSLQVSKGEVLCIKGRSGSGKSTLAKVLLCINAAYKGTIYIDNIPLSDIEEDHYYQLVSAVFQEPFLFNGTVRENIFTSASPEYPNSHPLILDFIESLAKEFDQGFDTVIGEDASKISGGQKQRVSFARALMSDCQIVILDEPTSALDQHNVLDVLKLVNLLQLAQKTVILITHNEVLHGEFSKTINMEDYKTTKELASLK